MADARVFQLWTVANRCRTDAIGVIWRELTDIREIDIERRLHEPMEFSCGQLDE